MKNLAVGLTGGILGSYLSGYIGCLVISGGYCTPLDMFEGMLPYWGLSTIPGVAFGVVTAVIVKEGQPSNNTSLVWVLGYSLFVASIVSGMALFVILIFALAIIRG